MIVDWRGFHHFWRGWLLFTPTQHFQACFEMCCSQEFLKEDWLTWPHSRNTWKIHHFWTVWYEEASKVEYTNRNDITKCAQDLHMHFFKQDQVPGGSERQDVNLVDASNVDSPPQAKCSKYQELMNDFLARKRQPSGSCSAGYSATAVLKMIENKMKAFEVTRERPSTLEKL